MITLYFTNSGGTPFTATSEELNNEFQPMTVAEYINWCLEHGCILDKVEES